MLNVIIVCHALFYDNCHHSECHYIRDRYAVNMQIVIVLSVFVLTVEAPQQSVFNCRKLVEKVLLSVWQGEGRGARVRRSISRPGANVIKLFFLLK
jgi:hypothetical protein